MPSWVTQLLLARAQESLAASAEPDPGDGPLCKGTVLSRTQYVVDVEQWGYQDARVEPHGAMSADDAATWTEAGLEQQRTDVPTT